MLARSRLQPKATGSGTGDGKVFATASDLTKDYLANKVSAISSDDSVSISGSVVGTPGNEVLQSDFKVNNAIFRYTRVLEVAEVLSLRSSPIELLPAITGYYYQILTVLAKAPSGTTPYVGTNMSVSEGGSDLFIDDRTLGQTDGRVRKWIEVQNTIVTGPSTPVKLTSPTDPISGDGEIEVTVLYVLMRY